MKKIFGKITLWQKALIFAVVFHLILLSLSRPTHVKISSKRIKSIRVSKFINSPLPPSSPPPQVNKNTINKEKSLPETVSKKITEGKKLVHEGVKNKTKLPKKDEPKGPVGQQNKETKLNSPPTKNLATSATTNNSNGGTAEVNSKTDLQAEVKEAYERQIITKIMQQWIKPLRLTNQDFCIWRVQISLTGTVVKIELENSSQNEALEISSREAIYSAQPFILPSDLEMAQKFLELRIVFKDH